MVHRLTEFVGGRTGWSRHRPSMLLPTRSVPVIGLLGGTRNGAVRVGWAGRVHRDSAIAGSRQERWPAAERRGKRRTLCGNCLEPRALRGSGRRPRHGGPDRGVAYPTPACAARKQCATNGCNSGANSRPLQRRECTAGVGTCRQADVSPIRLTAVGVCTHTTYWERAASDRRT